MTSGDDCSSTDFSDESTGAVSATLSLDKTSTTSWACDSGADTSASTLAFKSVTGRISSCTGSTWAAVGFSFSNKLRPHLPISEVIPITLSKGFPFSFWTVGRATHKNLLDYENIKIEKLYMRKVVN